jgi:Bacterial dnaA protein helix-turn-helix
MPMTRAESIIENIGAQFCELRGLLRITERVRQLPPSGPRPADRVINAVCAAFEISRMDLIGAYRSHDEVVARQAAMTLLHEAGWSYPRIGKVFGARHHTTVIYSVRKFRTRVTNPEVQARFAAAKTFLDESSMRTRGGE